MIGVCSAFYLVRRGYQVTIAARRREGCSFGNAGMVVPSHFVPLAAPGMVALGLKWMWNPESPFWVKPRLSPELLGWGWKFWRAANARRVSPVRFFVICTWRVVRPSRAFRRRRFRAGEERLADALPDSARVRRGGEGGGMGAARCSAEVLDAKAAAKLEPGMRMNIAGGVYFPNDCHLPPARFMHTCGSA